MAEKMYMQRALELAARGLGRTAPNPMVGCVIVKGGKVIGEGWHQEYGKPHAEVNAVERVQNKEDLVGSTVYVTLEPCAHFGKTPPCANMLAGLPLEKVVIANIDTSKKVDGRGLEILRQAGKIVSAGLMAEEGLFLNRRFFTFEQKKRPYIILKWARTHDGFIAREDYSSKWISNALSRKLVHKWRSEEPAIMVGKNTARYDNPALTVRDWTGNDPLRIVTDRHLELPSNLQLFDGKVSTLYYNLLKADKHENLEYIKLNPEQYLEQLVTDLASRDIQSVIIEGGATLLRSFIDLGLWDEARVFKSNKIFEKGITAPQIKGLLPVKSSLGSDELNIYYRDGA